MRQCPKKGNDAQEREEPRRSLRSMATGQCHPPAIAITLTKMKPRVRFFRQ